MYISYHHSYEYHQLTCRATSDPALAAVWNLHLTAAGGCGGLFGCPKMDGLCHGKSQGLMDDLVYPMTLETLIFLCSGACEAIETRRNQVLNHIYLKSSPEAVT